jgi:hypothetical protein
MRIDASLLKEILEALADHGYPRHSLEVREIKVEADVPRDKLEFHFVHLIKEHYLDGSIMGLEGATAQLIFIDRITDKGMLMLNAVESSAFKKWVKEQSGEAAEALWKTSAGIMWAYAKQWLAERGLRLPD